VNQEVSNLSLWLGKMCREMHRVLRSGSGESGSEYGMQVKCVEKCIEF
jgi:hypothetical protein